MCYTILSINHKYEVLQSNVFLPHHYYFSATC